MRGTELSHYRFAYSGQKMKDHMINDDKYGMKQKDRSIEQRCDSSVYAKQPKSPCMGKVVTKEKQ